MSIPNIFLHAIDSVQDAWTPADSADPASHLEADFLPALLQHSRWCFPSTWQSQLMCTDFRDGGELTREHLKVKLIKQDGSHSDPSTWEAETGVQ